MASGSWQQSQEHGPNKVQVTILASEWGSSKGGLSTINRKLAIQLANFSEVEITYFLPKCSQEDRRVALSNGIKILEAKRLPGFEELEWLNFPPEHFRIDVIVGHGVKLGHQAQVIRNSHKCKWIQLIHTDPEEQGMFKSYGNPISTGEEKHKVEVELCEMANFVVAVGPKLAEAFRKYLRFCQKHLDVFDLTPGIFDEFVSVQHVPEDGKHCSVLVFGRGDAEDFKLKGFDIAAKSVAALPGTSLIFVGAPDGKHEDIAKQLLECGIPEKHLRVRGYVTTREALKRLFHEVDLVLMPSRTEGFGLTGLEALSAGVPVIVSKNSGFGEALSDVPFGSSFVIDSEDANTWTVAIKDIWSKNRQTRLDEAKVLRDLYGTKYSWSEQCKDLVKKMINSVNGAPCEPQMLSEAQGKLKRKSSEDRKGEQSQLLFTSESFLSSSLASHRTKVSAGTSSDSLPSRDERLQDRKQELDEARCVTQMSCKSTIGFAHGSEDNGQKFTPDHNCDLYASVSFESDSEDPMSINIEDSDLLPKDKVGASSKQGICVLDQSGPLSGGSNISVSSSDSLPLSSAESTPVCSTSSSQGSYEKSAKAPELSLNTHSSAARVEIVNESDQGLKTGNSEEEVSGHVQILNSTDDVTDGGNTEVEDIEEQSADSGYSATRTSQSDARTSPLFEYDSQISSSDSSEYCRLIDPVSSHVVDGNPLQLQQSSNAHGQTALRMHESDQSSSSSTQIAISPPPPPPIASPVSDALAGDFLVRHPQDKAVHESLFANGRNFSILGNDTSQVTSFFDGKANSSEAYRARPYFGACQAVVRSDGNAFSAVPSGGFERAGLLGGSSYNESLYGNSAPDAAAAPSLRSHIGLSNVTFGWNGSSSNGVNNIDGFLNIDHEVTGQGDYSKESYFPYVQHNTHVGQVPLHCRSNAISGITRSGFAYGFSSAGLTFSPLDGGSAGIRPGHSQYATQRHVVRDGDSALIDEQAANERSHNADLSLGQQQSIAKRRHEPGTTAGSAVNVDNCGLRPQISVSASSVSSTRVVSATSRPLVVSASDNTPSIVNNTSRNSVFSSTTPGDGNSTTSSAPSSSNAYEDDSRGALLKKDNGTNDIEPIEDSLLALERRLADACALVERVLRKREEREQFEREIERNERMIREIRERERKEREEREIQEGERWPQQQEAVSSRSPWLCEHYKRHCRVRFPCCTQFYPCHRCHNSSRNCENEEAKACHATHLKCSFCEHEQEIDENSGVCGKCDAKMAAYFCFICKHFTNVDKNPYHCEKCGICRIHADKAFHCDVCNVCLDKRLEGNHKCRPDSGHDECCICLEDAFRGFQILPCSHKVHRECAIAMIQNGIRTCPVCRHPLYAAPSE